MLACPTKDNYVRMGTPHTPLKRNAERALAVLAEVMNESYVDWRENAGAVRDAYRRWCTAPLDRQAETHMAYVAALDQEESAASRYALAVAELERQAGA